MRNIIERLRSKKHPQRDGGMVFTKKFDAVMRPYITRVKKYQEIQIAIAKLKKLIFEKDLSISEFFRMCSNS